MNNKHIDVQKILRASNHYDVLGVSKNANKKEIKQAYREKALKYHPDKASISEAKQVFHKVTSAYEQLYSHDKRSNYDAELNRKTQQRAYQNNKPKKEEPKFSNNFTRPRKQQSFKPERQQFKYSKSEQRKPDFSKYFIPEPNPYNPKRSGGTFPEPDKNRNFPFDEEPKKRPAYKLRERQKQGWARIILTLFFFFLFWNYVPDFTKSEPKFLLQKNEIYSHKQYTPRYHFPYFIQPKDVNRSMEALQPKIQKLFLAKLQSDCQNALNMKQNFSRLIEKDPHDAIFWESQLKGVSYKPCKKILKLIRKWPDIGLRRFAHLIR